MSRVLVIFTNLWLKSPLIAFSTLCWELNTTPIYISEFLDENKYSAINKSTRDNLSHR